MPQNSARNKKKGVIADMKIWDKVKQNEPLYRAARTFFEAAAGVLTSWLAAEAGALDWTNSTAVKSAVTSAIILAVSTGLTAILNQKKPLNYQTPVSSTNP